MNILLVHGAAHTAQCWEKLTPLLTDLGHIVKLITLSGHGEERFFYHNVSLQDHAREVCQSASQFSAPCVLLGHSMGGFTISAAAELQPTLFSQLIYLTAWIPSVTFPNMLSLGQRFPNRDLGATAKISFLRGCGIPRTGEARKFFYSDATVGAQSDVGRYLCNQPLRPAFGKVKPSQHGCLRIPKSYIECTRDKAILIEHQRAMQTFMDFKQVVSLEADHSPFYGMPETLAGAIHSIICPKYGQ